MNNDRKKSSFLSPLAVIDGTHHKGHIYIKALSYGVQVRAIFVEYLTNNDNLMEKIFGRNVKSFNYNNLLVNLCGMKFAIYIIE
jgi:hypothetical protein